MAYVRQRGNQLAIVHGERDPQTKKVEQRVLFAIYSRPEAREILGQGSQGGDRRFEGLMEGQYPELRFDWTKVREAIAEKLEVLPETYEYQAQRLQGQFRSDLCAFTRQLSLADPQWLLSAAELVRGHRHELIFLRDLIDWRLRTCDQERTRWNRDDPFHWRFALSQREVPGEVEERAARLYEQRELDEAEGVFRLLVECFEGYAEGHNYLGLIALDRGELDEATAQFERTIELGRRKFRRRIAKKDYWNVLQTRPYVRGLRNLARALNQAGRYEEALVVCDRLEGECGDLDVAQAHRRSIHLNTGRWELVAAPSRELCRSSPGDNLTAALAAFELGRRDEAAWRFLHGALNLPRAAHMLLGLPCAPLSPSGSSGGKEVLDHNAGVHFRRDLQAFLATQGPSSRRFFRHLLQSPGVVALLEERAAVVERWSGPAEPRAEWRAALDRMQLMETPEFAREQAGRLDLEAPPPAGQKARKKTATRRRSTSSR
ncbi:MAG: hypothetical protein AB7N76_21565 [Planctomycetota bacterium]